MSLFLVCGVLVFFVIPGAVGLWVLSCVLREYRADRVPILLYHRLIERAAAERGEIPDDEMIWVSYDESFAAQMSYLREAGYETLDFNQYLDAREGRAKLPPKPVIVTFDDGYESNYTFAYPALLANGLAATIYVSPEPDEHTRSAVEGQDGFLSEDQMREMAANRISIESHGYTHCILTELDDDGVRRELRESKARLEEITGREVNHLAIPRGGYDRRIRKLAIEEGYRTVCCNNKGSASGWSDLMALPRIVIERDMSLEQFARCLTPRTGVVLRILGNLKRLPERIGGARFSKSIRDVLYQPMFARFFMTENLTKIVGAAAIAYLVAGISFWVYVARYLSV